MSLSPAEATVGSGTGRYQTGGIPWRPLPAGRSRSGTHLRKLAASASYRRRCGEFLCDSPKLLEEALLWQGALHTVTSTDQVPLPPIPAGSVMSGYRRT